MPTIAEKNKARSKAGATPAVKAVKERKPRTDKGKKRVPGTVPGRPVGSGKPVNAGLLGRMANVDAWLTKDKACIKAAGIAVAAGLDARTLQTMRDGQRVLIEAEVAAVELAGKARGYVPTRTY